MKYNIIYKVLLRTICAEYYRLNTGFFFVVIGFALGLLRPVEHIALATYVVHSYLLLGLLFTLWTLYNLKTVQFTLKTLAQEENLFLCNLYVLPLAVKYLALLLVQFVMFEPVILYSAFMGYYALQFGQYMALFLLIVFNILSVSAAALYYAFRLKHTAAVSEQSRLGRYINRRYTRPYFTFFLYHVLYKQLSVFILTKLFSLLLITGAVKLHVVENYSQVLLSLGILIAFSTNAVLAYHFNQFQQVDMHLFKNMPISLPRRFLNNVLTYLCLLMPEILLLLRHLAGDITLWAAITRVLFGLSLPLVLHSYVLYRQLDLEKFIRHIFFIVLFFFVCILFRTPVLLLAAINLTISCLIYQKHFYISEVIVPAEET